MSDNMQFSEMVNQIRKGNKIYKELGTHIISRKTSFTIDTDYMDVTQLMQMVKDSDEFEFMNSAKEWLSNLPDDAVVQKGERFILTPSAYDDDFSYAIRLYDGTLIQNVTSEFPINRSDIKGAVIDNGYSVICYGQVEISIDEDYYRDTGEVLWYVNV